MHEHDWNRRFILGEGGSPDATQSEGGGPLKQATAIEHRRFSPCPLDLATSLHDQGGAAMRGLVWRRWRDGGSRHEGAGGEQKNKAAE